MKISFGLAAGLVAALALAGCNADTERPAIPFADTTDKSLRDPDNGIREFYIDFARVERENPLSRADLGKITPENIASLTQEEVDQVYGRLTAGPIPDGPFHGGLFFPKGQNRTRLGEVLGGVGGYIADAKIAALENVGKQLWKGKVFYRNELVLRNMIDDLEPLKPLIQDIGTVRTTTIRRQGFLGSILPNNTVWLLFPAKLYCGQSLVDSRRESVIIDYAYSDEIDGYRASPDSLAGRGGTRIRDEIRMVRPGFYLGRAYANRLFLLNFTLYNPDVAASAFNSGKPIAEDCWAGEQARSETASR